MHIIESFKHLKNDEFPKKRMDWFFIFPLLLDENIQTGRHVVHNHAQIALLLYGRIYSLNNFKEIFTHPYYIAMLNSSYYTQLSILISSVLKHLFHCPLATIFLPFGLDNFIHTRNTLPNVPCPTSFILL